MLANVPLNNIKDIKFNIIRTRHIYTMKNIGIISLF